MDNAYSAITGPILGGVITERASWRWIYLFNAPAAALGIAIMLICWPSKEKSYKKPSITWHSIQQVDWVGAILLLAASILLVFALQEGGSTAYSWNSATIISTLTISGVCWIGFFAWISWLSFGNVLRLRAIFPFTIALTRPVGPAIMYVEFPRTNFDILLIHEKPHTTYWLSLLRCDYQPAPAFPGSQRRLSDYGWCTLATHAELHGVR